VKKLFRKKSLDFHKIKNPGVKKGYVFVNFKSEEDRDKALKTLDGFKIKGKTLRTSLAKPAADPMLRALKNKKPEGQNVDDGKTAEERMLASVCPLASMSYEEQLEEKAAAVREFASGLKAKIAAVWSQYGVDEKALGDLTEVKPFIPSPALDGYRGKCEFSVGRHPDTQEATVGFRVSSYRSGSVAVCGVENVPSVSPKMKAVVKAFETYVRSSKATPYDALNQKGHWRQLTLRESSSSGECLAWAQLHPQDLTPEEQRKIEDDLKATLPEAGVTTLYVQFAAKRAKGQPESPPELFHGPARITQRLLGLDFDISPQAFFQVNVAAAEKLFSAAADMAGVDAQTTVLDVCCGTGTIGLCLAGRCKQVLTP